ncbi:hypothetical protein LBMAG42_55080 [Deltaproteobacteria bacterium]|nr:hypothetical protein LBMAG42_55080 [Deltaproteobacteria bacterium]
MPPKQYQTVDEFLGDVDPDLAATLQGVRRAILAVSPAVGEGIKWNCLSFRTHEYFAALNVHRQRGRAVVLLVLHTGAKRKPGVEGGFAVSDPAGLLEWLGPDRAVVRFSDEADFAARREALVAVIGGWIARM